MRGSPRRNQAARETLLTLLRSLPDNEAAARAALEVCGGAPEESWRALLDEAAAHGVLGILAAVAPNRGVPEAVRSEMAQRIAVQEAWYSHVRGASESVVRLLAAADLRVCALKGPVLAERLYVHPEQRPSMDVDLLVHPRDVESASAALRSAGYAGDDPAAAAYQLEHGHHLHFAKRGQPDIELHFHAYAGFGVVLPADALLERARPYALGPTATALVPDAHDEFLYLSAHAAGHSFIRLLWLFDLKLLAARQDLDWTALLERAERAGLATALTYTLRLLRSWLQVDVPALLPRQSVRSRLANLLLTEVSRPSTPGSFDNLGGLLFTSMLCDRVGSSGWLLQHHLLRTTRRRLRRIAPAAVPERWAG